jgi:hypothetical protein
MAADLAGIGIGRTAVGLALAAALLAVTGCTADPAGEPTAVTGPSSGLSTSPSTTTSASLPPAPTTPPPTTAGSLDSATLPEPGDLGPGWEYRVEGADPEDGAGNDTPFQQRDPDEIVETTIPMGCEQRSASPVPTDVLQATYGHPGSGRYAVALRMRFDSPEAAQEFADVRAADLQACRDQPDDPYSGAPAPVLDVTVATDEFQTLATYQLLGEPETWTSAAAVMGTDVMTLDTDADPQSLVEWETIGYTVDVGAA